MEKRFVMKPMAPDDAVLQMELLGHDFYVFNNRDTGRTGVVYRRRSGDIGLIDEAE
jgi:putative sigma-54 modulation protein